jgi:hypothetical protein
VLAAAAALQTTAADAQTAVPPCTVPFVDLDRYAGDWFGMAPLASSPAVDGVDRKILGQGARERSVVGDHREYAGNHDARQQKSCDAGARQYRQVEKRELHVGWLRGARECAGTEHHEDDTP